MGSILLIPAVLWLHRCAAAVDSGSYVDCAQAGGACCLSPVRSAHAQDQEREVHQWTEVINERRAKL